MTRKQISNEEKIKQYDELSKELEDASYGNEEMSLLHQIRLLVHTYNVILDNFEFVRGNVNAKPIGILKQDDFQEVENVKTN